jgi:hypothetical protein
MVPRGTESLAPLNHLKELDLSNTQVTAGARLEAQHIASEMWDHRGFQRATTCQTLHFGRGRDNGGRSAYERRRNCQTSRKTVPFPVSRDPEHNPGIPRASHCGILMSEIKCRESRQEGRFSGLRISAAKPPWPARTWTSSACRVKESGEAAWT